MHFGPAGYPEGSKGPKDAMDKIHALGLNALEIEYVRGVRATPEKLAEIRKLSEERNITLTAHAPYFVSLNSDSDETREKSLGHIMDTVKAAHAIGAYSIAIHAASYGKTPDKATENVIVGLIKCKEMMDDLGIKDVILGTETMGKVATWGTLKEIAEVMDNVEGVHPVLDVSHIHARGNGRLKTKTDMEEMINEFLPLAAERPHFHISCIKYSEKGEISHLPLESKEPDMSLLAEILKDERRDCTFISESPLLEKDSLVFKSMFRQ
jgi:Endonuclease IV